ncbi:MAG: DUF222 domain-containing protein, partial [Candidatus Dormibacteria bacterium]
MFGDTSEVAAQLIALRHVIDCLELEFSSRVKLLAGATDGEYEGARSTQDWVRFNCKMSIAAAHTAVVVGDRAAELPASVAAVEEGKIGYGHLALLARTADWVMRGPIGAMPFDEQPLLEKALAQSVGRFSYECTHARHAADAEHALRDHVDAMERRWLELQRCENGDLLVRGRLDSVGGATLRTALEPLARRSGREDRRPRSRRLADALVELSAHVLDQGTLPQRGSMRPHLQVTATLETLRGLEGSPAGEMEFAGPVPSATVQRLACDAAVIRVLLDAESAVIDVGRARRTAPPATLRALRIRDGGCVWPGCETSETWTTPHHVLQWSADKGGTNTATMLLLCYRHHELVHEGGWQIARTEEGVITVPPLAGFVATSWATRGARPKRVVLR